MKQLLVLLVMLAGCAKAPEPSRVRKRYDGGQAYPMHYGTSYTPHAGMTIRDYFAAHAPPRTRRAGEDDNEAELEAKWRWEYADEMLRQR